VNVKKLFGWLQAPLKLASLWQHITCLDRTRMARFDYGKQCLVPCTSPICGAEFKCPSAKMFYHIFPLLFNSVHYIPPLAIDHLERQARLGSFAFVSICFR